MTHRSVLAAGALALGILALTAPTTSAAAPGKAAPFGGAIDKKMFSLPAASPTPAAPSLDAGTIKKLLLDGTPGDWKFVTSKTGALQSGVAVRVGSDYSGHCLTYKSQDAGINLGHVSDCSKTQGGENFRFTRAGGASGAIKYGDVVGVSIATDKDPLFLCYGVRDNGINLNWGKDDAQCKSRSGSKDNGVAQWKLMPPAGSSKKVGDGIDLADRFALHSVVAEQTVVKCARIYKVTYPPTWWAGDLKWRGDCMHHELIWTHRELLQSMGENPKELALKFVPEKYRSALEKLL